MTNSPLNRLSDTRKFDGKWYFFYAGSNEFTNLDDRKKRLMKLGYKIRIVKFSSPAHYKKPYYYRIYTLPEVKH